MFNESTIRWFWSVIKGDGELTEIRLIDKKGKNKTYSGYFTDIETLLQALRPFANSGLGVYYTLNKINDACYGRSQHDCFLLNPTTTSDTDITAREYVLIDIDPERPSETNASDEEVAYAWTTAQRVHNYLRDQGFYAPVIAMSGNGIHLLYKVRFQNTKEREELVKNFLLALDMMFGDNRAHVDTSVSNASRISKLIGTVSNKGANTEERPQRESYIIQVPDNFECTDITYFEKVAATIPTKEKPSRSNRYAPQEDFDLEQFFRDHDIAIHSQSKFSGGIKYILEECPFNSSHKHPDAAVFKMSNGALGFKCLHNSCQQYTWRDFRLHFDPEAYDKKEYYAHLQRQQYYAPPPPPPPIPADLPTPEDPAKGKKWLQMSDIKYINPAKIPYIPSGIIALDKKIMGLMMGDVTILTGLPSCGKTSLIGNLVLNVAQRGEKAALWSGEMQDFRVQSWIDQMAAGKNYVRAKEGYDNLYFAPKDVCDRVNEWLDGKLFLYNNEYGCKWNQLFQDIQEVVDSENIKLVILDNLMALDLTFQGEKNDKQTQFIKEIKDYAKRKNIHILLVAHPRKETSFQLLRPDSIAGTSDLGNLCDNLFIMHRVGRDFEKRAKGFFEQWQIEDWKRFSVVIEICKNRSFGVSDFIVGMYYEKESRRLKNEIAEHIVYGWQDEARVQQTLPLDDLPPDNDEFDKAQELDDLPF